jgi:dUTP pyrophosphatase
MSDDTFEPTDARRIIASHSGKKVTLTRVSRPTQERPHMVRQVSPKARFVPEAFEGMEDEAANNIKLLYKEAGIATNGSAAYDLRYVGKEPLILQPGEMKVVHSGLAIHLDNPNLVGLITPRSGLGCKGVVLGNLVGVIDSDYQGELKLALWNRHEQETETVLEIQPGERVAQYIVTQCFQVNPQWVTDFDNETERGENGFGHSGTV